MTYDGMNRLAQKTYSDPYTATPVNFSYDTGNSGCYTVGHLVSASEGSTTEGTNAYTCFDKMGRVLNSSQTIAGQTYSMTNAWDLAGERTTFTFPSHGWTNQ
jgi:hypothetical protein